MNKKFLSAILFGALALASTGSFVSCKDYDDDIKNLQTQINASSKDLADKVSALNTAISAAQSAAEAKAAAAQTAADKALKLAETAVSAEDLEKKLNDLAAKCATKDEADAIKALAEAAATKTELADAVKAVEAKIDAAVAETAAAKADIAALQEKVAEVEAAIAKAAKQEDLNTLATKVAALEAQLKTLSDGKTMITSVSLVEAYNQAQGNKLGEDGDVLSLGFKSVTEQTTVFGKGLPGEITFNADNTNPLATQTSTVVVRVNPATATFAKEDVKLVNSKGEALDLVEVTDVKPYDKLITTKSAANSGLWTLTVKVKSGVTKDALLAVTQNQKKKDICFAVAIGNETRSVVSTYDLTAAPVDYKPLAELDLFAKDKDASWKSIAEIRNRYNKTETGEKTEKEELVWKPMEAECKWTSPATAENTILKNEGELYQNVVKRSATSVTDNRDDVNVAGKSYLPKLLAAQVNKPIELSIASVLNSDNIPVVKDDIKGFYVSYDERNALESEPSEWNAWTSYEVENLNVVQEGNTGSITIKSEKAEGDVIGFRVFAVNLDGTLLDPDGRAFYVYVGNATKLGVVPTQTILAKEYVSTSTADFLADFKDAMKDAKGSYSAEGWTLTKRPTVKDKTGDDILGVIGNPTFEVHVETTTINDLTVDDTNIFNIDLSKVTKVWYEMHNPVSFLDGGTYEQEMNIYKTVGTTKVLVKTITVSFTKEMPNEAPVIQYITGQDSKLLFAPTSNPTELKDYGLQGSATIASDAYVNLNNVYYELSREQMLSIYYTVDNTTWKNADDGYANKFEGYNRIWTIGDVENQSLIFFYNNNDDAFKAMTQGSKHTIKFQGRYPNVSLAYDPETDKFKTDHTFYTENTTDFDVTYNCWDAFTTWTWNEDKNVIEVNGETVKGKFTPNLQWKTKGNAITWSGDCIKASNEKNPEIFNTTFNQYVLANVVVPVPSTAAKPNPYLQDVENPTQINNYFTPSLNAENGFTFEYSQNSQNPVKDVEQKLFMKVKDAFGHEITLELGTIKVLRQNGSAQN